LRGQAPAFTGIFALRAKNASSFPEPHQSSLFYRLFLKKTSFLGVWFNLILLIKERIKPATPLTAVFHMATN